MQSYLDREMVTRTDASIAKARIAEMNDQVARERTFLGNTKYEQDASRRAMCESIRARIKFYEDEIAYWTKSFPN